MKRSCTASLVLALIVGPMLTHAQTRPADRKPGATTRTSQPGATISPDATKLLDQMRDASAKLGAFRADGEIRGTFDIAGRRRDYTAKFTSVATGDGRFRHELEGLGLIVSDGKSVTLYDPRRNAFGTAKVAATVAPADKVFTPLIDVLIDENPQLLLTLTTEPQKLLALAATAIETDASAAAPTLIWRGDDIVRTFEFNPQSFLIRSMRIDYTGLFKRRGVVDAKAMVELRYMVVEPATTVDEKLLIYTPPAAASEFSLGEPQREIEPMNDAAPTQPEPVTQPSGQH
jgi:outer membrane lipoprotein-sorting protein